MDITEILSPLVDLGKLYFWLFFVPIIFPYLYVVLRKQAKQSTDSVPNVLPSIILSISAVLVPVLFGAFCGGLLDDTFQIHYFCTGIFVFMGLLLGIVLLLRQR